jgi:hypothetical protein
MPLLRRKPKFRGEWYWHTVGGEERVDFRIVRCQNGKVVATSGRQGYNRPEDAIATLRELGITDVVKVTL